MSERGSTGFDMEEGKRDKRGGGQEKGGGGGGGDGQGERYRKRGGRDGIKGKKSPYQHSSASLWEQQGGREGGRKRMKGLQGPLHIHKQQTCNSTKGETQSGQAGKDPEKKRSPARYPAIHLSLTHNRDLDLGQGHDNHT
ncbi:unnamed protein product [Pleuronectes platessa]|uniref:Uncharacterized protein n=1 Tax=Pleuronectes platessa TaxID=8262 RepID=A0A9N7UXQ4_PLEPL|nr:unnamed protein product [Pleuronectes platessa]